MMLSFLHQGTVQWKNYTYFIELEELRSNHASVSHQHPARVKIIGFIMDLLKYKSKRGGEICLFDGYEYIV